MNRLIHGERMKRHSGFLWITLLTLMSLLGSCTEKNAKPRLKGVLKIKYTPAGKEYKACCQGPYGSGPCSEFGSMYTINYDLFNSDIGDPCTYTDLYAPSPTPTPNSNRTGYLRNIPEANLPSR
jgi:hypothetical protein